MLTWANDQIIMDMCIHYQVVKMSLLTIPNLKVLDQSVIWRLQSK